MRRAQIEEELTSLAEELEEQAALCDKHRLGAKRGIVANPIHYGERMLGKAEAYRHAAGRVRTFAEVLR